MATFGGGDVHDHNFGHIRRGSVLVVGGDLGHIRLGIAGWRSGTLPMSMCIIFSPLQPPTDAGLCVFAGCGSAGADCQHVCGFVGSAASPGADGTRPCFARTLRGVRTVPGPAPTQSRFPHPEQMRLILAPREQTYRVYPRPGQEDLLASFRVLTAGPHRLLPPA